MALLCPRSGQGLLGPKAHTLGRWGVQMGLGCIGAKWGILPSFWVSGGEVSLSPVCRCLPFSAGARGVLALSVE